MRSIPDTSLPPGHHIDPELSDDIERAAMAVLELAALEGEAFRASLNDVLDVCRTTCKLANRPGAPATPLHTRAHTVLSDASSVLETHPKLDQFGRKSQGWIKRNLTWLEENFPELKIAKGKGTTEKR